MDTSLDLKFMERSESIVVQFGFRDLKSFVKNQALLMVMARMDKYKAENKRFEAKYEMVFFFSEIETISQKVPFLSVFICG